MKNIHTERLYSYNTLTQSVKSQTIKIKRIIFSLLANPKGFGALAPFIARSAKSATFRLEKKNI